MCYIMFIVATKLKRGVNMALNKFARIKVSEEQRDKYYKLAEVEYNGNFSGMVKDLLEKYEQELREKGVFIDER